MREWIPYPRYLIRKNIIRSILKGEDVKRKKGLEIGFGSGELLIFLSSKKMDMSGFDESNLAHNVAKERLIQQNCNVGLYKTYRDIPKKHFDYIFSLEVLEHIKDDSITLNAWLELLKENGKIIISVPAHQSRFGVLDLTVGHYRRYDKESLINILKNNGLQIIHFWSYGYPAINILEKISSFSLKRKSVTEFMKKEELSYKSFEATDSFLIRLVSNNFFLFPFYLLQHLFLKTDLGSGYIILAQKNKII